MLLSWNLTSRFDTVMYAVSGVVLAGAGALIAARHPRNPIGWLLCGFALLNALAGGRRPGLGAARGGRGLARGRRRRVARRDELAAEWVRLDPHVPAVPGRAPARPAVAAGALDRRGRARPGRARLGAEPGPGRRFRRPGATRWRSTALPTDAAARVGMTLFLGALVASAALAGGPVPPLDAATSASSSSGSPPRRRTPAWPCRVAFLLWYVTPVAQVLAASALTALAVARVRGDPALPPLRHRRHRRPDRRLRHRHRRCSPRPTASPPCCSAPASARGSGLGHRRGDAGRRGRVPAAARPGAGRRRPALPPRPLPGGAADGRLPRGPARRPRRARGGTGRPARADRGPRPANCWSSCRRASSTST